MLPLFIVPVAAGQATIRRYGDAERRTRAAAAAAAMAAAVDTRGVGPFLGWQSKHTSEWQRSQYQRSIPLGCDCRHRSHVNPARYPPPEYVEHEQDRPHCAGHVGAAPAEGAPASEMTGGTRI